MCVCVCCVRWQFESTLSRLSNNSLVGLLEGLETFLVYTKNLILYPDEKKYRKIKITNIHYQERLGHLQGAEEAMTTIGYLPQGEYLRLDETRIHSPENEAMLVHMEKQVVNKLNELKKQWALMPARTEASHSFSCVHAVGSHSAIGKRHNMEDDEIMIDSYGGDASTGFFGLYDGHGGRATVDFVVKALHMVPQRTATARLGLAHSMMASLADSDACVSVALCDVRVSEHGAAPEALPDE